MAEQTDQPIREPITLDTPIPERPRKDELIPEPKEEKLRAEVLAIESKINTLKQKRESIKMQLEQKYKGGLVEQTNEYARDFLDSRRTSRKDWSQEKSRLWEEFNNLKREFSTLKDEQMRVKNKIKIFEEDKIQARIDDLQRRHETVSLSLQEEKSIIAEIRELELSKPLVAEFRQRAGRLDHIKKSMTEIMNRIKDLTEKIQEASELIDEIQAKSKESRDKLKSEIPMLKDERTRLDEQINQLKEQKNKLHTDFKEQKKAYMKQQKLLKYIDIVTNRKKQLQEQEERRIKYEERMKEEEANRPHPYAREIQLCENFISYLTNLLPKEQQESEVSKPNLIEEPGFTYLPPKEQRIIPNLPKKKKERQRKKVSIAREVMNFPMELLNFLGSLGIKVPKDSDEIKDTITLLQNKKQEFESKEDEERLSELPPPNLPLSTLKAAAKSDWKTSDFPEPEEAKDKENYGIFEDETIRSSSFPQKRDERRGRGRGRIFRRY